MRFDGLIATVKAPRNDIIGAFKGQRDARKKAAEKVDNA
jgi:hypothetical protein